ncbi:unnamed protein product [Closterium sp. Yama58-4]|nr:unnamed protein product [Closterium sp. Yama58-4]
MSFTLDDLLGPAKSDGFEMFGTRTPQPSTSLAAGAADDMFSDWKASDKPSKAGENTKKLINFNSLVDFDLDSGFSKFDISMSDLDFADTNSDSPKAEPANTRPKLDQGLSLASSMNDEEKGECETEFGDCETSGLPENEKHTEEPTQDAKALSQDIPQLNESEIQCPREVNNTDNEPTARNSPGKTSNVSPNPAKSQTSLDVQQDEPLEPFETTEPLQSSKPVEPLESSESDEPLESPKPAEPLETSKPAERLESAKPVGPLASPAEPLESSKPAELLEFSKPADPQATKKPEQLIANSQAPNDNHSEVLMASKSMLELNKPSAASDPGKRGISKASLTQTRMSMNLTGQSARLANTSVKLLGEVRAESAVPAASMFKARGPQSTLPTASSLGQTPGVGKPMPARISSLTSLNKSTSLPLSRNAPKEPSSMSLGRQPAGKQRSISSSIQEKSSVKPLSLALRASIKPGGESARPANQTLKVSTSTNRLFCQGKTTTENGAVGNRISSLRKLPSISSKPTVATSVQPRVADLRVDEASPGTSAKPSALESQLNNTFVFGQQSASALDNSTSLSKDVTDVSKPDAQEILLIEPAEEKQDNGDMTLSFSAAEIAAKGQDDVQNMGMVVMQAGSRQLTEIQNKGIGELSKEFEGEATGVDELDQVYRMLQRKHEEAKELLVRVMINHNLLLRMNEKYSYENIEKKRQDILSLISRDTAEE